MFGMLRGTLERFKSDSAKKTAKVLISILSVQNCDLNCTFEVKGFLLISIVISGEKKRRN